MSLINIHPDFKLQEQSFTDAKHFLSFIKSNFSDDFVFLKDLFSDSMNVEVKTSGSTGKPKTILISKQAMLYSAEATGDFFNLPAKTTALYCLPSAYIAGKMMWVRALHLGWHLEVVTADSHPLKQTNLHFDFSAMIPMQVQNSLSQLDRIKKLIIGGAAINHSLEQALKKLPTASYQTYGMTETITHIAVKKISKEKSFYKSLPAVTISQDKRDCLVIAAPRISDLPILTNDIVHLKSKTEFEWLGRYDNVINSGGVKLFPEQIEAKLAIYIKQDFFVAAEVDDKLGEKLVLLIQSNQPLVDLKKQLSKVNLSKYEMPKHTYFLPTFVFTKNGKINRQKTLGLL